MTIPAQSAVYNQDNQTIYPVSTATWSGLSSTTWADWKQWAYSYNDSIVWQVPIIDLGYTPKYFTLTIKTIATASVSYNIYTSMTGEFAGEETETIIEPNDEGIASFYGRYCGIVITATKTTDMPTITGIEISYAEADETITVANLDSSTCSGTQTARVIPLPKTISQIVDIKIMPHETSSPYNLDVYVTNTPTSSYLIPKVISKSNTSPTFALVGVDNHARDGVVDIHMKVLPEQYMSGNNLLTR